ncbi:MAG: PAS domain-containing sensor histidine kinase [Rickettsiales bacterium]
MMDAFPGTALSLQLLPLIGATGAAIGYLLFFFWKRKLIKSTNFQWQEMILRTAHGGYYVWDAGREREDFSINLVNIFRLRDDQQNFKEFSCFFETDKEAFQRAFDKLVDGSRQRFTYNMMANICGNKRNFLCSGYRVENRDYKFQGVILWFFDVTEYMLKMNEMREDMQRSRRERRHLNDILNNIPVPIWQRDGDFHVRYCNLAYSRYVDEDDKHRAIPEIAPVLTKDVVEAVRSERPFDKEHYLVEGGERKLLHIYEIPVHQGGASVGYAVDVSDTQYLRKQIEAHVSAHEDLLESSSSAMAIYGKDTRLMHYNQAFVRMFGLSVEFLDSAPAYSEVLEKLRGLRRLPEQKDFAAFRKEQVGLFNRNLKEPANEFFHLPDGRSLRVIVISHALGGLLFVYEDLTDSLRIQSSYNKLAAVQKATLDYLKEGILLIGSDGRVTLFNPRFQEIFPGTDAFLAERPHVRELLEKTRNSYENVGSWAVFRDGFIEKSTGRNHASLMQEIDGRIYNVSFIPLPDGQVLASFLEVTAAAMTERMLHERNKALEEADKLKNDFLSTISYDLRTPLTSIIGFSDALKEEYFGGLAPGQRGYVRDIYGAANQLLAMINNIIDVARIRAGKFELQCSSFKTSHLIASVMRMADGVAKEKGVRLAQLSTLPRRAEMFADISRLEQLLFYVTHRAVVGCGFGGAELTLCADLHRKDGRDGVEFSVRMASQDGGADVRSVREFIYGSPSGERIAVRGADKNEFGAFLVRDIVERHGGLLHSADALRDDRVFACIVPQRADICAGEKDSSPTDAASSLNNATKRR